MYEPMTVSVFLVRVTMIMMIVAVMVIVLVVIVHIQMRIPLKDETVYAITGDELLKIG